MDIYRDKKRWNYNDSTGSVECEVYVAVTPNKQYTVSMYADGYSVYSSFSIEYSPNINSMHPTIYDY